MTVNHVTIDVQTLEKVHKIKLTKFRPGKTYPLSMLMKELRLEEGTPKMACGNRRKKHEVIKRNRNE